jgi:hypothetical protein
LFSAVLGVHNLLNNPKFDEETTNSKGGKGPVRSKLMWNLPFCEALEPPPVAGGREACCLLQRSSGSKQSDRHRKLIKELCLAV